VCQAGASASARAAAKSPSGGCTWTWASIYEQTARGLDEAICYCDDVAAAASAGCRCTVKTYFLLAYLSGIGTIVYYYILWSRPSFFPRIRRGWYYYDLRIFVPNWSGNLTILCLSAWYYYTITVPSAGDSGVIRNFSWGDINFYTQNNKLSSTVKW